ncbi:type II toxin-antitoxin system VapC family toxin [Kamptonema cortianum]|jgi:PIN domain nuclease of toxin-antitoxin system|nr:type II toxin-antitoxin system VapC family toxin [Geitlerinema splendidum]MDK3155605.1 type II toxin-antitoxin system VapC family toxin [Kamptonema cortianum]
MSEKAILDASALLALIQEEPGSDVIKPLLKNSVMSTVNVAEVLTSLQRVNMLPEEGLDYLSLLINEIVDFDVDQAKEAADLYPKVKHKGLSLGDRACLALGMKYKAKIYTADKVWRDVHPELDIRLIR